METFASDKKYEKFNAKNYLQIQYPKSLFDNPDPNLAAIHSLQCHHQFCEQFYKEWDKSTAHLLDLGGGPCIHFLISYVPNLAEIYHSDYVEACRGEVVLWKNNDPAAYDWFLYFKYVVNTLQGQAGKEAVVEHMEMAQSKLKGVFSCDVKSNNLLPDNVEKKFDIILSTWCIENMANFVEEYGNILKRVKLLFNPNGFFVTIANLKLGLK